MTAGLRHDCVHSCQPPTMMATIDGKARGAIHPTRAMHEMTCSMLRTAMPVLPASCLSTSDVSLVNRFTTLVQHAAERQQQRTM